MFSQVFLGEAISELNLVKHGSIGGVLFIVMASMAIDRKVQMLVRRIPIPLQGQ